MTTWHDDILDARKEARLEEWLADPVLIEDLSWGLVDTAVLHVRASRADVIVKAAGPGNTHIGREIRAHRGYTDPLVAQARTSRMLHADADLSLIALEYQSGILVQGSGNDLAPDVHRQAGETLRILRDSTRAIVDDDYMARAISKAVAWLDGEHRIEPAVEHETRRVLRTAAPKPVASVPTHGDWHTRNWLIDEGFVKAIDFGRFALRPAATDLCRLAVKEWRAAPALENAFLDGYGDDPRDPTLWRVDLLCEAIGTAAWAYHVQDDAFEAQGHRQLADALSLF